jgi:cell pole-organizing protein PopZ
MENGTVRLPTPLAPAVEPPVQRAEAKPPVADVFDRVPLRPQHDVVTSEAPVAAPASAAPQAPTRPDVLGNAFAGSLPDAASRPQPTSLPAKVEAAATLLSQETGAQVARSFGELAAVFDGVEARSLEEMAQDMLRPMLQEWLDDNLPTLVERLVREEIERVARGPRR